MLFRSRHADHRRGNETSGRATPCHRRHCRNHQGDFILDRDLVVRKKNISYSPVNVEKMISTLNKLKTSTKRKTPSKIKGYYMQETAYAKMFEEMYGVPINRIVTIIAVEETGQSQMFVDEPKKWIEPLKELRTQYREEYGI